MACNFYVSFTGRASDPTHTQASQAVSAAMTAAGVDTDGVAAFEAIIHDADAHVADLQRYRSMLATMSPADTARLWAGEETLAKFRDPDTGKASALSITPPTYAHAWQVRQARQRAAQDRLRACSVAEHRALSTGAEADVQALRTASQQANTSLNALWALDAWMAMLSRADVDASRAALKSELSRTCTAAATSAPRGTNKSGGLVHPPDPECISNRRSLHANLEAAVLPDRNGQVLIDRPPSVKAWAAGNAPRQRQRLQAGGASGVGVHPIQAWVQHALLSAFKSM